MSGLPPKHCDVQQITENRDVGSRLEEEKDRLERYFYPEKFPILRVNEEPCFEREVKFKNGHVYRLRVCIREGYPGVLPNLLVCESPEPMPSTSLWSGSHDSHTLPRRNDLLRICFWHPDCWTSVYNICHVFKKGEMWLKVYELKHLLERKPMRFYLPDMVPTQEDRMRIQAKIRAQFVQTWQRAILNNPTPSPDELFVNPFFREFMSALTTLHLNAPTPSPDELLILPFFREFMSALTAFHHNTLTPSQYELFVMNQYFCEFVPALTALNADSEDVTDGEKIQFFVEWSQRFLTNFVQLPQIARSAYNIE